MVKEKFDGIIFDMDGTIWDTTNEVTKIWSSVIAGYNLEKKGTTLQEIKNVMGMQDYEIGKMFFPELSVEKIEEIMDKCNVMTNKYIKAHGGTLYHGVEATVKELSKKIKLFIVSNCGYGYIEAFLEGNKMNGYFTDFEHPGRTGLSKGENIKLIVERNGLENPVYVGDTEMDRKACEEAGVPFIYASYGFGNVSEYDYKIDSFDKLKELCI